MEVNKLEEEEGQCPGCGTMWVGHSGFGPTSGEFPSKNAVSCSVHRASRALLDALKKIDEVATTRLALPSKQDNYLHLLSALAALTIIGEQARDAIEEARK